MIANRFSCGFSDGPFGTAQLFKTPSSSTGTQFFPGKRRRDCRVRNTGTEAVGGCCVATDAVLAIVNRHTTSPMRRTMSEGNQIWRDGSKLLSYRFDPGADALEGIPSS